MDGGRFREPVYAPDPEAIARSQLTRFIGYCETKLQRSFPEFAAFQRFSVEQFRDFWRLFLEWSRLPCEGDWAPVCRGDHCEQAVFFPNLRLNYADCLLAITEPSARDRPALTAVHDGERVQRLTRGELRDRVAALRAGLQRLGLRAGDRVVAVAYNNAEALIACLAAASLGATFSSAAPNMGSAAIVSRFEQLEPALLFCNLDAPLPAGGRTASLAANIEAVCAALPSLRAVIALDDGPAPSAGCAFLRLDDLAAPAAAADAAAWPTFPFNHPLFILFSSGTTGKPKCIVHGAGGTLIEHVKEHRLHCDLAPDDKLFFQTSCAWMMWNWQLSALASGAEIVLFDGAIAPDTLWSIVARERVTVFGTSAAYLQLCEDGGFSPVRALDLSALRAVLSTGSILFDRQYDWVRDHVGAVPLQSISGGTDIVGCFVLGNPNLPVYRGESQCRSLGYDVQAWHGSPLPDGSGIGDLVCCNPFPSRPLGLLGDADGRRFHDTYFSQNAGVWTHGDFIEFTFEGSARLHGRSDGVLSVRGIRIGPAEIYRVLQDVPEIREAMAVEQAMPQALGNSRMVLLLVLQDHARLDGTLIRTIKKTLGHALSAAHVPEVIIAVPALPITYSGKRSERAAQDAINRLPIKNLEALRNPDCLDAIRGHPGLATSETASPKPNRATPQTWEERLQVIWERLLNLSPIEADDNFFDLGGHSLLAFRLFSEIRELTGRDYPLATLLYAPTIAELAAILREERPIAFRCLVPVKPGGTEPPLFIVHGLYGNVLDLRRLAGLLETQRPVYALQARGLVAGLPAHRRVEDMARDYIEEIRTVQPHGPYALAGHSFGGLVAFEMARRLVAQGDIVEHVLLFDTDVHVGNLSWADWLRFQGGRCWRVGRNLGGAGRERRIAYLRRLCVEHVPLSFRSVAHPFRELESPPVPQHLQDVHRASIRAMNSYRAKPYPGVVGYFRAAVREPRRCDPLPVWQRVAEHVEVYHVSGEHMTLMHEPHVRVLARHVSRHLEAGRRHREPPPDVRTAVPGDVVRA